MKSVSYFTLLILFIMSRPGQFASGDVLRFTLNSFIERAVAKDIGVGQSVFAMDAAEARKTVALAAPDPEVSLSYGSAALGHDEGERAVGVSLARLGRRVAQGSDETSYFSRKGPFPADSRCS